MASFRTTGQSLVQAHPKPSSDAGDDSAAIAHSAAPVPGLVDAAELAKDRQFATNLARGLEVLRAFTPDEPMLGNRELTDRTGLPKATVWRLTYTLTLLGYLSYVEKFQKYRLGSGVLSLGYPLLASMKVRQVARPFMEQIARETGCTVNLGMRDRLNAVYVDTCRVDQGNIYQPDIGSTRPLLSTSIGHVLLLSATQQERAAILNRLKLNDPDNYDRLLPMLLEDEKRLREQGYCHSPGGWRREIHAVAVPIRQGPGEECIALNATMSAFRLQADTLQREVVPRLREATLRIEQATGMYP